MIIHGFITSVKLKNNLSHITLQNPSNDDIIDCIDLYEKSENEFNSFEQNPSWNLKIQGISFHLIKFYRLELLIGFCIAKNKPGYKEILFGPILKKNSDLNEVLRYLSKIYVSSKCFGLEIQLPFINDRYRIFDSVDSIKTIKQIDEYWCTQLLNLEESIETIFQNFSKNHKRSIKKAKKHNIEIHTIKEDNDIQSFITLYEQMYSKKGINSEFKNPRESLSSIISLINAKHCGICLGVFHENKLIGGLIMLKQGNSLFYRIGCTNNQTNKIPTLHIAFFEAIKIAKVMKVKYFDFGGYAVTPDNQLIGINRFKSGFGGQIVKYPRKILIIYNPMIYKLLRYLVRIKRKLKI